MDVRVLSRDHRQAAIELWVQAQLTRPWNDPSDDFDRAVSGTSSDVLGAFAGDTLAATVMVGEDGHRGWAYYLAVGEEHRRTGLGRLLMSAAERWLIDRGVTKLNLMVRQPNTSALAFYEQLGYSGEDVTVLSRWLVTPS